MLIIASIVYSSPNSLKLEMFNFLYKNNPLVLSVLLTIYKSIKVKNSLVINTYPKLELLVINNKRLIPKEDNAKLR
mgnify:CR=1 FL=1